MKSNTKLTGSVWQIVVVFGTIVVTFSAGIPTILPSNVITGILAVEVTVEIL